DWLVHFDYQLNKLGGVGTPPREAAIYTGIFKARPDVNAAVHSHAPMCVALSLADKPVSCVQMQSDCFGRGVPIYPKPIYILDDAEGADLARTLNQAVAVMIKGHGIVTLGKRLTRPVCALYEWNAPPRSWLWPSFSDLKVFRTILSSNFVEARRNFSHDKEPERRIPQTGLTTLTRSKKAKSGPEAGPNRCGQP